MGNSFQARVVTSAQRLASLMFQLQLTGYMFKNAEYRMAISKSAQKQLDSADNNVRGKVKVNEIEVDADSYVSELRTEIKKLKEELMASPDKDLLSYIRSMPPTEMRELTNVSENVLTAMKGLVNAVMTGISTDISPDTSIEQIGEAIAQLCMWQLVSGYNLRELEIREEMKVKLKLGSSSSASGDSYDNNDDDFTPGLQS